jgi:cyclohexanone monooxygenase
VRPDAIIVGGGFSGVAALVMLRRAGLDARLLEAGDDVGGVWYWNRYPGARCDLEVFDYSFAFEEVEQEWSWSHRLALGGELQRHIAYCVDRYDLRRFVDCGQRVTRATYDEDAHGWTLETAAGATHTATAVVWATGVLSASQLPDIPGAADFAGLAVHTSDWPAEGIDLDGRTVGVIGTGSSGVQIIPELAEHAQRLVVFQRTANHVVPANNVVLDDAARAEMRRLAPERRAVARTSASGLSVGANDRRAYEVDDDERRATYERHWDLGGFNMLRAFSDLGVDEAAARTADAFVRDKIREVIDDPETAEKLMPADHPFNTKRMGVGVGYYEAFNRDDVRLCDARTEPIERITPDGVRLATGEDVPLDVLVFATGFDSFTGAMARVDIRGRAGATMREAWADGARTYLGLTVAGFPNLFMIGGPGGPSIFANAPITSEHAGGWIAALLRTMKAEGIDAVEALPEPQEAWTAHLIDAAEQTLYSRLRNSWYHGANTPGKPQVFMGYVGGVDRYNAKLAQVAADGYDGFALTRRGATERTA